MVTGGVLLGWYHLPDAIKAFGAGARVVEGTPTEGMVGETGTGGEGVEVRLSQMESGGEVKDYQSPRWDQDAGQDRMRSSMISVTGV